MSQVEHADGILKRRWRRFYDRFLKRLEGPVKRFEWTWTTAIVFSLGFTTFLLVAAIIVPSFWLYLAEGKLDWKGPSDLEALIEHPLGPELRLQIRDTIAMGLTVGPIATALVVAAAMQNWRKKLRGGGEARPTGGYR